MTNEPQFYKYFQYYVPDHREKVDLALKHLTENGYTPVWGPLIGKDDW